MVTGDNKLNKFLNILFATSPSTKFRSNQRGGVGVIYGLGLRKIGRSEFFKPYPKMIDRENPYPKGYMIPNFSLFFGDARSIFQRQST